MEVDSPPINEKHEEDEELSTLTSSLSNLSIKVNKFQAFPEKHVKRALNSPARCEQTHTIVRQEVSATKDEVAALSILVLSQFFYSRSPTLLISSTISTAILVRNLGRNLVTVAAYQFRTNTVSPDRKRRLSAHSGWAKESHKSLPSEWQMRMATVRSGYGKRPFIIFIVSLIRIAVVLMVLWLVMRGVNSPHGIVGVVQDCTRRWAKRLGDTQDWMINMKKRVLRFSM